MKFFVDTAKIEDIKKAEEMGVICGVTTNPSLIAKEGGRSQEEVLKEIADIVDGPISGEVKATTTDASQARPGYVPVADGTAGNYAYGDYTTLSTSWQQVSYEFTLSASTTVCLVVMNPKKSNYSSGKDFIIDDATLTKK